MSENKDWELARHDVGTIVVQPCGRSSPAMAQAAAAAVMPDWCWML